MTALYLRSLGYEYAPSIGEVRCDECRGAGAIANFDGDPMGSEFECDRCAGAGFIPGPCPLCGDALDDDGECPACLCEQREAQSLLNDENVGAAEHRTVLAGNLVRAKRSAAA